MKRIFTLFLGLMFILPVLSFSAGDLTYLSDEEYQKLKNEEETQAYWDKLQAELDYWNNRYEDAVKDIDKNEQEVAELEKNIKELEAEIAAQEREIEAVKAKIEKSAGMPYDVLITMPTSHTVSRGETLSGIAGMENVYNDKGMWGRLYRENRDKITNPHMIYPDMNLKIRYGKPKLYTVKKGESLWRISGYWEIYNDPTQYMKIYQANKDKIKNPDIIHPKQVLNIPREW